jgi:plastocyanin
MYRLLAYVKTFSLAFAWLFFIVWMDRSWVEQHGGAAFGQSGAAERQVVLEARDFRFTPNRFQARPGERLLITLTNRGGMPHGIAFEFADKQRSMRQAVQPGQSSTISITAPQQPGTYLYYCPVGNHRDQGMTGRLVVAAQTPGG